MIEIILKILVSYLVGSMMGGLILSKITGAEDIRKVGSKSAGATNAFRTHGKAFGASVFIIDILRSGCAHALHNDRIVVTDDNTANLDRACWVSG